MKIDKKEVLGFLKEEAGRPLFIKEILKYLGLAKEHRKALKRALEEMVREGALVKIKGGRYGIPAKMNLVSGTLQGHPDGFGFVLPDDEGGDVYVRAKNLREAMHGDRVAVRVESGRGRGKREGRIIRIIERANQTLVGRFERGKKFGFLVPADNRIVQDLYIPRGDDMDAADGDIVQAEITSYPTASRNPEGRIVQILGRPDDPEVEIKSIVIRHGIPSEFPAHVLAEAERIEETVPESEMEGRVDLRGMTTVTIDGETARDFDDAIAVKEEKDGSIRLWVSIADVSHYVREGSELDKEAINRATSVYFPDRCIPMLPERLSNGICSLNPNVDRLAMTAEMRFDARGNRLEERFYNSVIRSDYRLTYNEVKKVLVDDDKALKLKYEKLLPEFRIMEELYRRLKGFRDERGCLDFDLPEAQIVLDIQGGVEAIVRSERNVAHMIIEECMLAANEAVASWLTDKKVPLLYRVHEPPDIDKMHDFREFIYNFGYALKKENPDAKDLKKIIEAVSGKPEERTINHVLLRSMKQAVYSGKNIGHFGLASKLYCHFTSPIRRYPDLTVHRALKKALAGEIKKSELGAMKERLPTVGEETSTKERRAMEAEREIVSLYKTQFMADKVGEEYAGFITGVTSFGFFVELESLYVEGLVHISSIDDDYYIYDEKGHELLGERTKRLFRIGDEVQVRVERVDIEKRQIDFGLL